MTVPWLMNCAHVEAGWCTACVARLGNAAEAVVNLDDGDKPDLWHYQTEFQALRDALGGDSVTEIGGV